MFNLFKKKLPDCNQLFVTYIAPWLPDDSFRKMPRPDMYVIAAFEGQPLNLGQIQYLSDESIVQQKDQIVEMQAAALGDYQHIVSSDELTIDVLDAVDKHYDKDRIADVIKKSEPSDFSNDYLIEVAEFGAMLGKLFSEKPGFGWLYSFPYFNSIIVHEETGFGIPVFDWAVKKFSSYGWDDGFAAKIEAALESVRRRQSDLY